MDHPACPPLATLVRRGRLIDRRESGAAADLPLTEVGGNTRPGGVIQPVTPRSVVFGDGVGGSPGRVEVVDGAPGSVECVSPPMTNALVAVACAAPEAPGE